MGSKTSIEWTATVNPDGTVTQGSTWNPLRGTKGMWTCTKVSPGCTHCYAERLNMSKRHGSGPAYVVGADTARLDERILTQPSRWKRPRKIFVCSMTDLFGEWVPDEWIGRIFVEMNRAYWQTHQILTKRAERMMKLLQHPPLSFPVCMLRGSPLQNVHLGVSVESPAYYARIDALRQTPSAVRFLSLEPLLAPMPNLPLRCPRDHNKDGDCDRHPMGCPKIDWVIVGGESGGPPERALVERSVRAGTSFDAVFGSHLGPLQPKPEALRWVRDIRDQCVAAKVSFFHKQWGGRTPKSGGRMLDGRTWDEFPTGGLKQ